MALKRYIYPALRATYYCNREAKRLKDVVNDDDELEMSAEFSITSEVYRQQRDSVVSVVLAGGIVEAYDGPILAYRVKERHPGLCLARPDVFCRPNESVVGNEERLINGEKFYLVPWSTVKKLQRNAKPKKRSVEEAERVLSPPPPHVAKVEEEEDGGSSTASEDVCSAKDYFVSKDKWTQCYVRRFGNGEEHQQQKPIKRPADKPNVQFKPPIVISRIQHGPLMGWKPKLTTITESPP